MRSHLPLCAVLLIATPGIAACSGDDKGKAADAGPDAGDPPSAIADHQFGGFEPWATPIQDYVDFNNDPGWLPYDESVNELFVFGDRMWIGYGDGTYNMGGWLPIEFRYFSSPDDPEAFAAEVDGAGEGAEQETPYESGEEVIVRYRDCDGALWQAGADSTDDDELWTQANTDPPAIEGNVFKLDGDTWIKHRAIPGGEHVQDIGWWSGALYAVGSGADTRAEFEAGQIFRYLWRSVDDGQTFETVQRIQHPEPGAGDTRFVHIVSLADELLLFGYESDFESNTSYIRNAVYDGASVEELDSGDPLSQVFGLGSLALPDGTALLTGVDISTSTFRYTIWHVAADGTGTELDGLEGFQVIDMGYYGDSEELLLLTYDGDAYGGDFPAEYAIKVWVADLAAPNQPAQVATHTSELPVHGIAFWGHALFLSTDDGQVLKATHQSQ